MDFHEDTDQVDGANVYNGQNSTLWCNFREAFADEIQETYQKLRGDGLITYDMLEEQFITKGSDKWSESVFNEDGEFKYVSMVKSDNDASNLPFARGDGEQHFKYFVENRLNYLDSKWYATDYANDYVSLRIYTPTDADGNPRTDLAIPASADITVTPYSNMYAGVRYKANGTLYQEKVEHGVPITFEAPNETFNDTETAIYGASQLSSLGDLAPLYCGTVNVANATKLTEIKIGDATEGYANNNLKELSVGTNKLLKKIDIQNCPSFTSPLGLAGCQNIEEVYAKGSGITGVELADSGYLKIIQLPATIANLTMKNQEYLEEFSMEGYGALKTMQVENCPVIDTLTILDNATNLERVRLTGVNWTYPDVSFLRELMDRNLAGIDENGANTDNMWIDGTCHIEILTGNEMAEINAMYPYLTITYDNLTADLIFMSEDGETELCRQTISNGGNGVDPTTNNTIDTPTKESTAQYDFTFSGWATTLGGEADANALSKVEANRYVYVAFTSAIRSYTVNFYTGSTLLETHIVEYGSDATYGGSTPTHESGEDYYEFTGWKPEPTNIQGNTNCYAQFYDTREIHDDWATIAANVDNCTATDLYAIGSYKPVEITYEDGTTETIEMEVIAHNHDELADGSFKWEKVGEMPYTYCNGSSVIYNNELHVLGGAWSGTNHYKYNGTSWTSVSTLPYSYSNVNTAIVYNNEIHILGGVGNNTKHYKYDGTEWTEVSTLPYYGSSQNAVAFVYNDEIHLLGIGSGANYYLIKWDGSEWTNVTTLPTVTYGKTIQGLDTVIYNDELHMLISYNSSASNEHYKWDGSTWIKVSDLPTPFGGLKANVYDDKIHIMGGNGIYAHYAWDGSTWTELTTLPFNNFNAGMEVFNNEIHIFGSNTQSVSRNHYKWSTKSWVSVETMPYHIAAYSRAYEIDNKLHIVNGNSYHVYDGNEWTQISNSLENGQNGYIIELCNGEFYALKNASTAAIGDPLYKLDGTTWVESGIVTPYAFYNGGLMTHNGELYMIGGLWSGSKCFYKLNGTEWIDMGSLPINIYDSMCVYNNEIHVFDTGSGKKHYKWNGNEWILVGTTPAIFGKPKTFVEYNGKLYTHKDGLFYVFDGVEWSEFCSINNHNTHMSELIMFRGQMHLIGGQFKLYNHYVYKNPKATLTFMAKNALKDNRAMNTTPKVEGVTHPSGKYSAGGWKLTDLREYLNGNFYSYLPTDLQSAIKLTSKLSDGGYGNHIFVQTEDKVWIPSFDEVNCRKDVSDVILHGQGECYPVFTTWDTIIRTKVDGTEGQWWLRSTWNTTGGFNNVVKTGRYNGYSSVANATNTSVCFGFCI